MARYAISGVWKNSNNVITHYAIHTFTTENDISKATKTTKTAAVSLLDNSQNSAITILWNYTHEKWERGTTVTVVGTSPNRYLRTTHDSTVRDNLGHLIDYEYVANNFI